MTLIINNKTTDVEATTVQQLADALALPDKGVAIAIKNKMVPRSAWTETMLCENDSIVIIKAACGG